MCDAEKDTELSSLSLRMESFHHSINALNFFFCCCCFYLLQNFTRSLHKTAVFMLLITSVIHEAFDHFATMTVV